MKFIRNNLQKENQFIFGSNDLSNIVVVEKITRQVLPPMYLSSISIKGKEGRIFQDSKTESRTIMLSLRFIEDSYKEVQERVTELGNLLYSREPKKLILRDSEKYNYAIVSQITEVDKDMGTGMCEVVFECHDPYNYGETKIIPLTSVTTINNTGESETPPTMNLVTKQADKIKITLNDGDHIELIGGFIAGATLVIDFRKETVRINSNLAMDKLTLDSDFFLLPKGESVLKIEGVTGDIEFTERWI